MFGLERDLQSIAKPYLRVEGVSGINWVYWTLLIAVVAGVLGTIIWVVGGSYVIAYLATFPPRRRLKRTPEKFGAAFENINFPSRDGTMLSGWFVPASVPDPQGVVVLVSRHDGEPGAKCCPGPSHCGKRAWPC